jgi:hypothetical protein
VLVVTEPDQSTTPLIHQAYGSTFDKDVPLLLSEIDPVQNRAVDAAVKTAGFSDTKVWSGQPGKCGDLPPSPSATAEANTCFPPAVNYTPLYFLVNGVSFDRTVTASPAAAVPASAVTGAVLLRLVNAGLRMHVPAVTGGSFTLLAEDGNKLPGTPRVQSEVFLAAGKTYDVAITPKQSVTGFYDPATYAVFDRALSLSTSNQRDGGMQVYVNVAGGAPAGTPGSSSTVTTLTASDKSFTCFQGTTLTVADPGLGVLGGAVGANGVVLATPPSVGTLDLRPDGTFTYVPPAAPASCSTTFTYLVNGTQSHTATIADCANAVSCAGARPVAGPGSFTSNLSSEIRIPPPGVLQFVTNTGGYSLTAVLGAAATTCGTGSLTLNPDGSFVVKPATTTGTTCTFTYNVKTSSQQTSLSDGTIMVTFPAPSNLAVNVVDAKNGVAITDYRWIIEEDKTFWIDPKCQVNSTDPSLRPSTCPPLPVESLGYSFHTAHMDVVAQGCMGTISCEAGQTVQGQSATCDIGNGACRATSDPSKLGIFVDNTAGQKTPLDPRNVHLDPAKRYFLSILPGDGVNPTIGGAGGPDTSGKPFDIATACGSYNPTDPRWKPGNLGDANGNNTAICGHAMGGAQIAPGQTAINIKLQETPLPTAKIAVFIFQDDNPLNGENDAGGGVDVLAPNEAGLGGFDIKLFDQAGGLGDATGQITYDMFNQPVSNSLAGKTDPITGLDSCPITSRTDGLVGIISACPKYESDGKTLSPLAGQAVIANLYPGLYEIQAYPGADRIARGEEWLQTNTLDGGKPHEAFIKPNEPGYFQEFGPGGFHVSIGFANPAIINARKAAYCSSTLNGPSGSANYCGANLDVKVTNAHMSRTPDQRTYSTETYDHYSFTTCYVSIGVADGADFAFQKCDDKGVAHFTGLPAGTFKISVFDQWNDIMLDGLVGTLQIANATGTQTKEFPVTQWRTNLYTRTFIDTNRDGVSQDTEPGLALVSTNIRYRDGSFGFFNNTDLNGYAGFNEVFPFMNWLVVETSSTRFKPTGVHTVYDAGGPVDCSNQANALSMPCSNIAANIASTKERFPLPQAASGPKLGVPGAKYCDNADCPAGDAGGGASTGTIFPPQAWGTTQGWQGLLGQNSFMEFAMQPYQPNENGGIAGHVIYASTRPFDDPALLLQLSWEPGVPNVRVNLYQKTTDASGNEQLRLVDWTTTTSWDAWTQGFRKDAAGNLMTDSSGNYIPNISCPGQDPTSLFFQTLKDSKQWLDPARHPLPYDSQFKCYDGWSMLNQIQPAPYDGMYKFPSVVTVNPTTGKPATSNCTACTTNAVDGNPMLPPGKYVVEVIVPTGYELVKEEDKNILLGDVYIAPVTQQFAGFGNIFIMPDQAAVNAYYNKNSPGALDQTTNQGRRSLPSSEGDTGSVESFWPCVGAERIVPDLNSLYPGAGQAAPFAGAKRRLCDRKEVLLTDQASVLAKFYIFSSTHVAGHFTGLMTNDFASEFDPFSPQFGEKFGPPNLPVAMRDFSGNEVARVYSDQWGVYNGLYFSTYGVNPPNPTGYVPQMSIACMNDPGPIPDPSGAIDPATGKVKLITDPAYNPAYSNFCYETPFMPGFTAYMDTPVIPTQAFADGYNLPDSEYPDATPAISSVVGGSGIPGPWVSAAGQTLTITALGNKVVQNPAFSGPNSTTAPYNQKTITRHYGFGGTAGTAALVGSDGVARPLTGTVTWSDTTITGAVPTGLPACKLQQAGQPTAYCGQLVITAANGKQSIDAITVTVGGSAPWVVKPNDVATNTGGSVAAPTGKSVHDYGANFGRMYTSPLQIAIDSASPGDLIIVTPGVYRENVIMWKPVRLQGVGAASAIINADAHPAGKMDEWRRQNNCAFGLTLDGTPNLNNKNFDPTGTYSCPDAMHQRVDRISFEAIVGWDASGNGNLAQVLQEPTLMGAYEGAGITVLGRGVRIPAGSTDFWGTNATGGPGAFTDGSVWLTNGSADCTASTTLTSGLDYGTSNFLCNPSRIDGLSIINSSQGGGGLFIHGWAHNLEVANMRISGNHGTLAGAINLGNGETPDAFINDGVECGVNPVVMPCPPIPAGTATNAAIPFQFNRNVRIHHNMLYNNASIGDALFSGTPAGAGGITVSAGADGYQIDHNWIAGNLSTGDGGGLQHLGLSFNGKISNNFILFNQSTNPTLPTNGGGVIVEGANLDRTLNGTECGSTSDQDCPPGLGEGAGPGLVIDANLILGNSAESGSGGGLRIQQVNGSEVIAFPRNPLQWYDVTVTNNVIANNVAGWDGGGVSMEDAFKVTFTNNTVASNDTTASAGVLFKTLGAINAASPPPGCTPQTDPTLPQDPSCTGATAQHNPQPAGLVVAANTPNMVTAMAGVAPGLLGVKVLCPIGYGYTGLLGANGDCMSVSKPNMVNDLFWQNRAFQVDVVGTGTGNLSQQALVALTPALAQTTTGQCVTPSGTVPNTFYWDIGIRRDDFGHPVPAATTLSLATSILTGDTQGVIASMTGNIVPAASPVLAPYCNGARMPPEHCTDAGIDQNSPTCKGFNAPPGASETTGLTQLFTFTGIQPTATVDEGHNWLNLVYGPLALYNDAGKAMITGPTSGLALGAYSIPSTSQAINAGTNLGAPDHDFFGTPRPQGGRVEIGAVEFVAPGVAVAVVSPAQLAFGAVLAGTSVIQNLTLTNNGGAAFTGITIAVTPAPFSRVTTGTFPAGAPNCAATLAAGASCTIKVQYAAPTTVNTVSSGTVAITGSVAVTNAPVQLSGSSAAATYSASVSPIPLAFGNWATGTTSSALNLTVTNTGNSPLTNLTYTFGGGTPQPFARVATGTTCAANLAVGASCTFRVQFAPGTATTFSRTLTVANGAAPAPQRIASVAATLTGTGVATRATASIAPSPLTITLPSGATNITGTGTVTLTNTAPPGGSSVNVTNVAVSGGSLLTYFFNVVAGTDTCTGVPLAPGQSCTVGVRFTNVGSARGTNRTGTITFTDTATGSPQSGGLIGFATP